MDDLPQAERVPVEFVTLVAAVPVEELPQRYQLAPAGQLHHCIEFGLTERLVLLDVLNRADRDFGDIEAIERVPAVRAAAAFQARLPACDAGAALGTATAPAPAAHWAIYICSYGHG
ncbi:hypothetical protein MYX84_10730 [Acidobacteria bacterium AH-259-O06]|nr:hypothetical protein [Acidobacteria bacterium AH-259-G07]MDA2930403.1 hypothetical protein [Acidobacteria bacterium AH-259-O06]